LVENLRFQWSDRIISLKFFKIYFRPFYLRISLPYDAWVKHLFTLIILCNLSWVFASLVKFL
jgi:hypothetical protein